MMYFKKKSFQVQPEDLQSTKNNFKASTYSAFKGLIFAMLSAVSYSITSVIVKHVKALDPDQLTLYRFIAMVAISLPETIKCGENPLGPRNLRFLLLMRGIFGGTSTYLSYISYRYLPLGDAAVILSSIPAFVTVTACIFLKEPCGVFQSVTIALSIIGILITTKLPSYLLGDSPNYTTENIYGLFGAIGTLFLRVGQTVLVRKAKSVHYAVMTFNFSCVAVVESVILIVLFGNLKWHHCDLQILYIILLGLFSYTTVFFITIALHCEFAGPVSTLRNAGNMVLAFLWQIFLFHNNPDYLTIVGAILVGISIILISLRRWVSSLSENSSQRKRLKWMLS
ncbi:hypothetical protein CDAR_461061 [Caerostris darwini]|uniref:EamA domain-containing protein n=1 Tax=Caerostris darwini TaxID=1538125 RepID=A0AAV4W2F2_9ARAC|nr:hypothetical protein CDAR_461061 [Caerostris darwini]